MSGTSDPTPDTETPQAPPPAGGTTPGTKPVDQAAQRDAGKEREEAGGYD